MTIPTRDVLVREIWPHRTSIYISRIAGGGATHANPVVEFAGMVETFEADDENTTKVGMPALEEYLNHRMLRERKVYRNVPQTQIGERLVQAAQEDGIPLTADADASEHARDRTYEKWDHKVIGEAIQELSDLEDGFDWELRHTKEDGAWSTQMIFRDYVGADRGVILASDREAFGYGLDVDASEHATLVDAIGSGEELYQIVATAQDNSGIYPRFDAAPAWNDVTLLKTLQPYANGYLLEHREPSAVPSLTLRGMVPDPAQVRLGDTVQVETEYGAVTYHGPARVTTISWAVEADEPETRTLSMSPMTRASESVFNQEPTTRNCRDC